MEEELKKIKKLYGEKMMHLCRSLFPTILEEKGKLLSILESRFNPSKYLYDDIVSRELEEKFKNYIYKLFNRDKNIIKEENLLTPQELLDKAGYKLFECHSEADIQSFRHYYYRKGGTPIYNGRTPESRKDEELCTFNGNRLDQCHVFFAVRKDVDLIKRDNFPNPKREDDYGTSVLSIQFSKGNLNTLSIKNRYNHAVENPDSTFSNDLDNIINGLTSSFEKYYNLNINKSNNENFEIPNYVLSNDGKFYRYNYEINDIYYCTDNIIIDNHRIIKEYNREKERYLFLDYFILDLKEKRIFKYDKDNNDSFTDDLVNIENISINNGENDEKEIIITKENKEKIYITIDKYSRIIKYRNDSIKKIENDFLYWNQVLNDIELPSIKEIGNRFLYCNDKLLHIEFPSIRKIGASFLMLNNVLTNIELPNVKEIDNSFLYRNNRLQHIELSNVEKIGYGFLMLNKILTSIELPNVKKIESDFLYWNQNLTHIELPCVIEIGSNFLERNKVLNEIKLPNVKEIGNNFLSWNQELMQIDFPNVEKIGHRFLDNIELCNNEYENEGSFKKNTLRYIELPNVREIGTNFLASNDTLRHIELPRVIEIGDRFLYQNQVLEHIELPCVKEIGDRFLYENEKLIYIELPNIEKIGNLFLANNKYIGHKEGLIIFKNKLLKHIKKSKNDNKEERNDKRHS